MSTTKRSKTTYRRELRANRQWHFDRNIADALRRAGADPAVIEPNVLREMRNLQNRTRGQIFELLGEVLSGTLVGRSGGTPGPAGTEETVFQRQRRFSTPIGERRIDLYVPAKKSALEVKSGYVTLRRSIRKQVAKDEWLLENSSDVDEVVWLLFRGGSRALIARLEKAGIKHADLEWDVEEPER